MVEAERTRSNLQHLDSRPRRSEVIEMMMVIYHGHVANLSRTELELVLARRIARIDVVYSKG